MRTIPLPKLSSFARLCAVSLAVVVTLGACSEGDNAAEVDAFPPSYEELDLSSPEAAATTFVEAFAREDYLTAYRALSVESQEVLATLPGFLFADGGPATIGQRYDWLDTQYRAAARADLDDWIVTHHIDAWGLPGELQAESMLRTLARLGALTVDLTGGVSSIEPIRTGADTAELRGRLDATTDGRAVTITLVTGPGGDWRIHQVATAGGDDTVFPFAGDTDGPPSGPVSPTWTSTADRLRPDDPDAAVAQAIRIFDERDWRMLVGSFHADTAVAAFRGISEQRFQGRFLTLDTPDYFERFAEFLDEGSVVYGYLTSLPYEHGDETGTLQVDLQGGKASPAVRTSTWGGDEAWAAEVRTGEDTYVVTVARSSMGGLALAQIRTLDGSTDRDAAPFSAPARGFTVPEDAEVCPDGIVRYDCGSSSRTVGRTLTEADEARIEALRKEADADPNLEAQNQVIIQSILNSSRGEPVDVYCAAMQLGYVHDDTIEWRLAADEVAYLAESHCPGDPSVIPTG